MTQQGTTIPDYSIVQIMIQILIDDIRGVLLHPNKFFQNVRESGLPHAYRQYIVLLAFFSVIAGWIRMFDNDHAIREMLQIVPDYGPYIAEKICPIIAEFGIAIIIGTFLAGIYLVFIAGALIHPFVLLVGGEQGFGQTMKVQMYAATPTLLFGWVPVMGIIGIVWSSIIMVIGLKECAGLSLIRSVLAVIVPIFLFASFFLIIIITIQSFTMVLNPIYWLT